MKITILEFAPCADSIYHLRRDEEEGYIAGDAVHAGFSLARWVWGFDSERAARYGQAAAAASVGSPDGTRGVSKRAVEELFAALDAGRL